MPADKPYTAIVHGARVSALLQVRAMLEERALTSVEEFHDLMSAVFLHGGFEMRRLSDDLGHSFSSVYRWVENRSTPHQALWPRIIEWVREEIDTVVAGGLDGQSGAAEVVG